MKKLNDKKRLTDNSTPMERAEWLVGLPATDMNEASDDRSDEADTPEELVGWRDLVLASKQQSDFGPSALVTILHDDTRPAKTRAYAARLLGERTSTTSLDALRVAADDADLKVRTAAISALKRRFENAGTEQTTGADPLAKFSLTGKLLKGLVQRDQYTVLRPLGKRGGSYIAQVVGSDQQVVVKTPPLELLPKSSLDSLRRVVEPVKQGFTVWRRLNGATSVAHPIDYGSYVRKMEVDGEMRSFDVPFFVEEHLRGAHRLWRYLRDFYGREGRFSGIPTAKDWFNEAKLVVHSVKEMHDFGTVHGDISVENILVTERGRVIVDVGENHLEDLYDLEGTNHYSPPEHVKFQTLREVSHDIYTLGAVLLYMAVGDATAPPVLDDNDSLKRFLADAIARTNPALYSACAGITDIISECLRYDVGSRAPHAEAVLRRLDMFEPASTGETLAYHNLGAVKRSAWRLLDALWKSNQPLFQARVIQQARHLELEIESMLAGKFELTGTRDEIASGFTECMSLLGKGDQYLTVTVPSFWRGENLGIDDVYRSMNQCIGSKGAAIRRVLIVTYKELVGDPKVAAMLRAQQRMTNELTQQGIRTDDRSLDGEGCFTGFLVKSDAERTAMLGGNFALWRMQDSDVLITPKYTNGVITKVVFQDHADESVPLRAHMESLLKVALPITDWEEEREKAKEYLSDRCLKLTIVEHRRDA